MARPTLFNQIGFIYFIESETQNAVKIGFTADVQARLKGIQTGNPDLLTLAAHVRATFGAEQALHKALGKFRHQGLSSRPFRPRLNPSQGGVDGKAF